MEAPGSVGSPDLMECSAACVPAPPSTQPNPRCRVRSKGRLQRPRMTFPPTRPLNRVALKRNVCKTRFCRLIILQVPMCITSPNPLRRSSFVMLTCDVA
jgi:hypothetical protein